MRRPRKHLLALLLLVPMLAGSAASSSAATPESEEFSFLQSTNDARAAAGLAPLKMSTSLVEYARSHSARMLQAGTIFHTEDLAVVANERVPRWQRAGENVGVGGSVDSLHNALMNS
ncbi:MAG: CAP domain-containing protein, partial [Actinobacteria bacterium]|nr:CAP domain-containing protein [Actinomycetota bacterium]